MPPPFPVIDLFAGPGGLGEGFSAFRATRGNAGFKVRLSIEMDAVAHRTLLLRKFYRAFDEPPDAYHAYVRGEIRRTELFAKYSVQHEAAEADAWCIELGERNRGIVAERVESALHGAHAWALIGGPPCQAYSLVGRSRMQSSTNPDFEKDHRHLLYREYLRIVARHRPPVFLMENVEGLLSATHGGDRMIDRILLDLHEPVRALRLRGQAALRYRLFPVGQAKDGLHDLPDPRSLLVRSEDHGVPQARHRVFILGIREDLNVTPRILETTDPVSVADVIDDLPRLRSMISRGHDSAEGWREAIRGVREQRWYREPQSRQIRDTAREAKKALSVLTGSELGTGSPWQPWTARPKRLPTWYRSGSRGISNHEARGHMTSDLHRYFFMACFAQANGRSATLRDFPDELMPKHRNAEQGRRGKAHTDRFKSQVPDAPSSTITSHISKDGHKYIHYDPVQCRSLTVREAARLQTFPDSYHFEGPPTEQYHQVGNAVPPLLARQIAAIVHDVLQRI
jgi:DNA (cytosine-5)-methyltransferase 1